MKPLLILPALMLSLILQAEDKGIHFQSGTFADLTAKAKQERTLIFLDCYTSWCGPCKWMEKNVFPNDTVADYFNTHFVCASFDMEKGEGIELAKNYAVTCYPTFLFIDSTGKLIHRSSGAFSVKRMLALGHAALDPTLQFATIETNAGKSTATAADLFAYLQARSATCLSTDSILSRYMAMQTEADYTNGANWFLFRFYVRDPHEPMVSYVVSHRSVFDAIHTKDSVDMALAGIYNKAIQAALAGDHPDSMRFDTLRKNMLSLGLRNSDSIALSLTMRLYGATKEWARYAPAATAYTNRYMTGNAIMLNNMAWFFYENISDPAYLDSACAWAKESMRLDPDKYYNTDTYAAILYKLGRKKEAEQAATKAIALADKEKADATETKELLAKIRTMK